MHGKFPSSNLPEWVYSADTASLSGAAFEMRFIKRLEFEILGEKQKRWRQSSEHSV
jgi:hypothetical protein